MDYLSGQKRSLFKEEQFEGSNNSNKKGGDENIISNVEQLFSSLSQQNTASNSCVLNRALIERIKSWENSIQKAAQKIRNDDLIETMKEDITSETFLHLRIKEILQEVIFEEKEIAVANLQKKLDLVEKQLEDKDAQIQITNKTINYHLLELEGLKRTLYEFEIIHQQKDLKIESVEAKCTDLQNKIQAGNEELNATKQQIQKYSNKLNEQLNSNLLLSEQIKQLSELNTHNLNVINQIKLDSIQQQSVYSKQIQELTQTLKNGFEEEKKAITEKGKEKVKKLKIIISSLNQELLLIKHNYSQTSSDLQHSQNQLIKMQQNFETQEIQNQHRIQLNQIEKQNLSSLKFELSSLTLDLKKKEEELKSLQENLKFNFISLSEHKKQIENLEQESSSQKRNQNIQSHQQKTEIEQMIQQIETLNSQNKLLSQENYSIKQSLQKEIVELKETETKTLNEQQILRSLINQLKAEQQELKEKLKKKEISEENERKEKISLKLSNNKLSEQLKEKEEVIITKKQELSQLEYQINLLNQLNQNSSTSSRNNLNIIQELQQKLNFITEQEQKYVDKISKCNETIVMQQKQISKQQKILEKSEQKLLSQQTAFQALGKQKETVDLAYQEKVTEVSQLVLLQQNQLAEHNNLIALKQKEVEELQLKFKLYRHELEDIKKKIGESVVEIIRKVKDDLIETQQLATFHLSQYAEQIQLIKKQIYERIKLNTIEINSLTKSYVVQISEIDGIKDNLEHEIKQRDLLFEEKKQEIMDLQRINLVNQNIVEELQNKLTCLNQTNHKLTDSLQTLKQNVHQLQPYDQNQFIQEFTLLQENHESNIKQINQIYEERINKLKKNLFLQEQGFQAQQEQSIEQFEQLQKKYLQCEQEKLKLKEYIMQNIGIKMNKINTNLQCQCFDNDLSPSILKSSLNQLHNHDETEQAIEFGNTERSRQLRDELSQLQQSIRNTKLEQSQKIRQRSQECSSYYQNSNSTKKQIKYSNNKNIHKNHINTSFSNNFSSIINNNNNNNNKTTHNSSPQNISKILPNLRLSTKYLEYPNQTERGKISSLFDDNFNPSDNKSFLISTKVYKQIDSQNMSSLTNLRNSNQKQFQDIYQKIDNLFESPNIKNRHQNHQNGNREGIKQNSEQPVRTIPQSINYIIPNQTPQKTKSSINKDDPSINIKNKNTFSTEETKQLNQI